MQKDRWKGASGNAWVELQAVTDQMMAGLVPPLVEGLSGSVLDVGCGTGVTTVAAARTADRVVGTDISEAMIEAARQRDPSLEFVVADAQTQTLNLITIVECDVGDDDSADTDWLEPANRRQLAGAANLDVDRFESRLGFLGGKFVREAPARRSGDEA